VVFTRGCSLQSCHLLQLLVIQVAISAVHLFETLKHFVVSNYTNLWHLAYLKIRWALTAKFIIWNGCIIWHIWWNWFKNLVLKVVCPVLLFCFTSGKGISLIFYIVNLFFLKVPHLSKRTWQWQWCYPHSICFKYNLCTQWHKKRVIVYNWIKPWLLSRWKCLLLLFLDPHLLFKNFIFLFVHSCLFK
jgi:hypothetical protein